MHKNIFRQGSEKKYFSRTLTEFKDFSRQVLKFQDLFKTVRTMRAGVEIRAAQLHNLLYFSPPSHPWHFTGLPSFLPRASQGSATNVFLVLRILTMCFTLSIVGHIFTSWTFTRYHARRWRHCSHVIWTCAGIASWLSKADMTAQLQSWARIVTW